MPIIPLHVLSVKFTTKYYHVKVYVWIMLGLLYGSHYVLFVLLTLR